MLTTWRLLRRDPLIKSQGKKKHLAKQSLASLVTRSTIKQTFSAWFYDVHGDTRQDFEVLSPGRANPMKSLKLSLSGKQQKRSIRRGRAFYSPDCCFLSFVFSFLVQHYTALEINGTTLSCFRSCCFFFFILMQSTHSEGNGSFNSSTLNCNANNTRSTFELGGKNYKKLIKHKYYVNKICYWEAD